MMSKLDAHTVRWLQFLGACRMLSLAPILHDELWVRANRLQLTHV